MNRASTGFERLLFAARWIMAPIYLGLVAALVLLLVVFARQVWSYALQAPSLSGDSVILAVLTLIDLALVGNLIVIVVLSGYESVVSRIDLAEGEERPSWMGSVDFAGLKMKVIASIVAISAIDLLKSYLAIGSAEGAASDRDLLWLTVIHLTFVVSGLLMALSDWLSARTGKKVG